MKGNVLLFNTESGDGLINSTSDVRFKFSRKSWISDSVPKTGDRVDFVADGEFAKEICLDPDFFPQSAAGASSGQHTRQPPPTPIGRTQDSDPPVPFNVMKEDDLPRSNVMAVELSCLLAVIVAIVIVVSSIAIAPNSRSNPAPVIFAIALFFTAILVVSIYRLIIIYRIWKSIQPFGVRTSPAAAVGYCFVPFYNFYWLFHIYHGWALNFNSKVRESHPHLPPISTGRAKAACIGTIFSIIPYLGTFFFPFIELFIVVPFLSRADRRARYLLDGIDNGISNGIKDSIDENTARKWAMLFHFSPLNPLVGFIATIIIWQVKKDIVPGLDEHGRSVANWHFSCVVYLIVSSILNDIGLYFIGGVLMNAVVVCYIVFPIIGGLKAKKGEVWRYPLSIQFFS